MINNMFILMVLTMITVSLFIGQGRPTELDTTTTQSVLPTPTNCEFSGYLPTQLYCVDLGHLKDITPKTADNVESLSVRNCAVGFQRFPVIDMLPRLEKVKVECGKMTNLTVAEGAFHGHAGDHGNITDITMAMNGIASIPDSEFCHLDKLNALDLAGNRIKHLSQIGLGNQTTSCKSGSSLKFLLLSRNDIRKVPKGSCLLSLSNVWRIELNDNRISVIEPEAFGASDNSSRLSMLTLSTNRLKTLPAKTFSHLNNLEQLFLQNNSLVSMDNYLFAGLRKLEKLHLQYNRLDRLHSDAFVDLEKLETLHLAHNVLKELPEGIFRSLKSLQFLFLNDNRLSSLDSKVFVGLTDLSYLNVEDNGIETIADRTFEPLANLAWLYLKNTKLTTMPGLRLPELLELYLSNCSIASVNSTSLDLAPKLQILHLDHNRIETVGEFAFTNLTSLTLVDLSHNHIATFDATVSLDTLNLSYNRIRNVNDATPEFTHLSTMKTFDLSFNLIGGTVEARRFSADVERILLNDNRIKRIKKDAFMQYDQLAEVTLDNNRLRHLELATPMYNKRETRIAKLRLGGNPWLCDCNLRWLKQLIEGERDSKHSYYVQDSNEVKCERLYHRGLSRFEVSLSNADASEDFMCTFSKNDSSYCLVWSDVPMTICEPPCPEQCTCYRGAEWEVIIVDCSVRNLSRVPSVDDLHRATVSLFLDHNRIAVVGANDLDVQFERFRLLSLKDNVLEKIEDGAFRRLATMDRLFLGSNRLRSLAPDLFVNLTELIELDLSANRLTNLSEELFEPMIKLETLLLNDNHLYTFPVWNFDKLVHLEAIGLYDNPWSCDCDYVASYTDWMRANARKLKNVDEMYCLMAGSADSKANQTRMSFIAFNKTVCFGAPPTVFVNRGEIAILTTSLAVLITIVLVSTFVFVYRREMQVLVYSRYGIRLFHDGDRAARDDDDANKLFDAFVSYSSLDEDFVIQELLPGLEGGLVHGGNRRTYKLCLHHRDFPIGAFINESIFEAIDKSRRTILVLSENFVRSVWCRFEFRTAHSQMLQDRRNRVILIILGDIPKNLDPEMRLYLRTKTYLCWNDRFFWEKLYFAMPEMTPRDNVVDVDEHAL